MFKAKKEGYLHITLFFSLICGDHGYIFSGNSGYIGSIVFGRRGVPEEMGLQNRRVAPRATDIPSLRDLKKDRK